VDGLGVDGAQPHFGPGKVTHDRDASAGGLGSGTDAGDDLRVLVETPVRKVEPRDIHAGVDDAF
jgi:hypothetical protein